MSRPNPQRNDNLIVKHSLLQHKFLLSGFTSFRFFTFFIKKERKSKK